MKAPEVARRNDAIPRARNGDCGAGTDRNGTAGTGTDDANFLIASDIRSSEAKNWRLRPKNRLEF
jgi:hypothetical protein